MNSTRAGRPLLQPALHGYALHPGRLLDRDHENWIADESRHDYFLYWMALVQFESCRPLLLHRTVVVREMLDKSRHF